MSKFLLAFHGGKMPDNPEAMQAIMSKWETWMGSLGSAMIDPGSIVGNNELVTASGQQAPAADAVLTGYMMISSPSMDEALVIANGCPILENQGSVQVAELMSPP